MFEHFFFILIKHISNGTTYNAYIIMLIYIDGMFFFLIWIQTYYIVKPNWYRVQMRRNLFDLQPLLINCHVYVYNTLYKH